MRTYEGTSSRTEQPDETPDLMGRRCVTGGDERGAHVDVHVNLSDRLAQLARECVAGQRARVELELHQWSRDPACPTAARALLASLLACRGRTTDAIEVLSDAWGDLVGEGADALRLRVVLSILHDDADASDFWSQRLADHVDDDNESTAVWLQAVRDADAPDAAGDTVVHELADALRDAPHVMASLVRAQHLEPDSDDITLLRQAIAEVFEPTLDDRERLQCCVALAELAMLVGDADEARHWSHRGLAIDPYCATLAMTLARVKDDPAAGPTARAALQLVAAKHPTWPDVDAALIRRQFQDGQLADARWRLSTWRQRHPDHPLLPIVTNPIKEAAA